MTEFILLVVEDIVLIAITRDELPVLAIIWMLIAILLASVYVGYHLYKYRQQKNIETIRNLRATNPSLHEED